MSGSNGGRPPKYETADALQARVDEYFNGGSDMRKVVTRDGDVLEIPVLTITGLVLFLGFCNRASFYDLEQDPKFSNTIKAARSRIEHEYERLLQGGLGAGAIFALKNFGWRDDQNLNLGGQRDNPLTVVRIE
jgi:hypothetical protein